MNDFSQSESICCPPFDPSPWEDKIHEWSNKLFLKRSVCTFFYMPINFGSAMRRLDRQTREEGAGIPDNMCLSDHTSKWNMDVFLAVDREIAYAKMVQLSGKFYSRVYEGSYKDTGKWCRDYEEKAKEKGLQIKKWYMWYTTCPKCAKKYGKNYVVIISEVE